MANYPKEEIKWTTKSEYVDIDTGEKLDKELVEKQYIIIKKKKHSEKYKSTGTTTITNECRLAREPKRTQGKLFE